MHKFVLQYFFVYPVLSFLLENFCRKIWFDAFRVVKAMINSSCREASASRCPCLVFTSTPMLIQLPQLSFNFQWKGRADYLVSSAFLPDLQSSHEPYVKHVRLGLSMTLRTSDLTTLQTSNRVIFQRSSAIFLCFAIEPFSMSVNA